VETRVASAKQEVIIGGGRPTVLIGERINPTGKKRLAEALKSGDLSVVREEAQAQVAAGADILDVNVGATGVDEVAMLPEAVKAVAEVVDVPLCIDSRKVEALEAALAVCPGRPIVNSVTGEEESLEAVLPLVKERGLSVIGLTLDEEGIPAEAEKRVAIAKRIVKRAEEAGISREDVIIDCLALSLGADVQAGVAALEAIRTVRDDLGVNQTQGASNISHGLPNRPVLNGAYLALAISGVDRPRLGAGRIREALHRSIPRRRSGQGGVNESRRRKTTKVIDLVLEVWQSESPAMVE
jgi:5-methyltetrahydrofolate--homocysteine methyltransferase